MVVIGVEIAFAAMNLGETTKEVPAETLGAFSYLEMGRHEGTRLPRRLLWKLKL